MDYVWMQHPTLAGQVVEVPSSSVVYWQSKGWVVIAFPPNDESPFLSELVSMVDAKGDLLVATGDNAVVRRSVGPAGSVLTADPTDPTGVTWLNAAKVYDLSTSDGQMALIDADAGSAYRVQQDLRLSNTIAAQVPGIVTDVGDLLYAPLGGTPVNGPLTTGKNMLDSTLATADHYWGGEPVGSPGALVGHTAFAAVTVTPGGTYTIQKARNICAFDGSGNFTGALAYINNADGSDETIVIPGSGVAKIGVSVLNADVGAAMMEVGPAASAYEPYLLKVPRLGDTGGRFADRLDALDAQAARVEAGLTVYRDGNSILVRHPHDDSTTDLVTPLSLATATVYGDTRVQLAIQGGWASVRTIAKATTDAAIWPIPATIPGTLVQYADDDNAPINACGSYIGGNHGWGCGAQVTLAAHGKVAADLGSTWTDGARTYTLLKIVSSSVLLFGCPYTVASGRVTVSTTRPSGTLTHVSGATNTSSVSIAGGNVFAQIGPTSHTRTVDAKIDGQRLNDGITHGAALEVTETYTVVSYKGLLDWSQANIGTDPFADLTVKTGLARISNTWRWAGDRTCVVGQTISVAEEFAGFQMVTQAGGLALPASGSIRQYVPGATGTTAGINLATLSNLTSDMSGDLTIALAQQEGTAEPVSRAYQYGYSSGGARLYGLLVGLLPVMDGKLATRKTNGTDTASWYMPSGTKKNYPRLTGPAKVFTVASSYSGVAFRRYLSPEDPAETVISDGSRAWVLIDTPTANATAKVAKAPTVQGRALVDAETSTVTRAKDYVTPEGVTYTNAAPGHMLAEATVSAAV